MMGIQPEGEDLRKAVKWIGEEKKADPEKSIKALVGEAGVKFNLSPKDADFLARFEFGKDEI
jgi:hypothetical protein